jgi:hypothetical protein
MLAGMVEGAVSHKSHCTLVQYQLSQGQAGFKIITEVEFLDEIRTKVIRVFSHLFSFALGFIFIQSHATSYSFYSSVTVYVKGKEENLMKTIPPSP